MDIDKVQKQLNELKISVILNSVAIIALAIGLLLSQ